MYELMQIYDIDRQIVECFDENGECSNLERLQSLELARDDIIEGVGLLAKQAGAMFNALKNEEDNIKARKEAYKRLLDRTKTTLAVITDGEKFETPRVCVSHRKSSKVVITDEEAIPPMFIRTEIKTTVDKKALAVALKEGEVAGAVLVTNDNIQIK